MLDKCIQSQVLGMCRSVVRHMLVMDNLARCNQCLELGTCRMVTDRCTRVTCSQTPVLDIDRKD